MAHIVFTVPTASYKEVTIGGEVVVNPPIGNGMVKTVRRGTKPPIGTATKNTPTIEFVMAENQILVWCFATDANRDAEFALVYDY